MQNIKGWITCLRPFSPRTISLSDSHTLIRNIATIAENTAFQKDTLYIGALMNAAYRFRTAEEISFVLIDDPKYYLDRRLCGNNTVIILEEGTDRDKVYEACKEYIRIQESILEKRQNLLDCGSAGRKASNPLSSIQTTAAPDGQQTLSSLQKMSLTENSQRSLQTRNG